MSATVSHQDRAALQAERDFLLRSIEDLQAERSAGELDEERYQRLIEDYTARAAAALRALDGSAELLPAPPPVGARSQLRRVAVVGGLIAVATVASLLLASSLGLRQPGETITGNAQSAGGSRAAFQLAVERRPDDVAARLAYARFLLQSGEIVDALRQYDEAAELDPGNAESLAYGAWIVYLAGFADDAMGRVDRAVAADPDYPDAHFFRGMMLLRENDDRVAAASELRTYLRLAPEGPMRAQVESVLAGIEDDPGGTPP